VDLTLFTNRDFLGEAMDPPTPASVTQSIQNLIEIGALDQKENLTPLGYHLAQLPVPANVGKARLYL